MLRIQPLRVQRDEAIYECTATNSLGEINTSAKLSVLEGASRGLGCEGETDVWPAGQPVRQPTLSPPWAGVCLAEGRTGHLGSAKVSSGWGWSLGFWRCRGSCVLLSRGLAQVGSGA